MLGPRRQSGQDEERRLLHAPLLHVIDIHQPSTYSKPLGSLFFRTSRGCEYPGLGRPHPGAAARSPVTSSHHDRLLARRRVNGPGYRPGRMPWHGPQEPSASRTFTPRHSAWALWALTRCARRSVPGNGRSGKAAVAKIPCQLPRSHLPERRARQIQSARPLLVTTGNPKPGRPPNTSWMNTSVHQTRGSDVSGSASSA